MAAVEGLRLWDELHQYDDRIGPDYCRSACGAKRCAGCPAPALLPDVVPAALAFGLVRTQWVVGGIGGRVGLNYPACFATWAVHREPLQLPPDPELHLDVMTIEAALLKCDSERADADAAARERDRRDIGE